MEEFVFSNFKGNHHILYGQKCERLAVKCLKYIYGLNTVEESNGLVINIHAPWLAFSPDEFIVKEDRVYLIEIKSPAAGKTLCGPELLRKLDYLEEIDPFHFLLKKKHPYYDQIQLGLILCNLKMGILVIYAKKQISWISVPFDRVFAAKFLKTLTTVYFNHLLPFLVNNENRL